MKITLIVLDSVGVGALPDAAQFGGHVGDIAFNDVGSHTLNHTLAQAGTRLPNLERLGLGHIPTVDLPNHPQPNLHVMGSYGRMLEVSAGKDTSTGHWEFMGIQLEHPFQTFYTGYPPAVMQAFSQAIGRDWLCNLPYSGTEVIKDYGPQHLQTALPIVYTSADSVFQIAAHLDVVPIEQLYAWCEAARAILQGEYAVARVIARPFRGEFPFERASELRRDYSLTPPFNVLNALQNAGKDVIAVGKIGDIYDHIGITLERHTGSNLEGIHVTLEQMQSDFDGLVFTNLVDFDAKYGHRRDVAGYASALEEFDQHLPALLGAVPEGGMLILVSDHGNDPTWQGSDHTREHALLLVYRPGKPSVYLGERSSFADLGATIAQALNVEWKGHGSSFWGMLGG
jgi:phosphopentomutase